MSNVIIIGNGPAGISAALYTTRAGIKTTVIGKDNGALNKAKEIENYYGFEQPVSGTELVARGIAQAKRLGAEIINAEVVGITYADNFVIRTQTSELNADSIIIATGSSRSAPPIKGLKDFEGKGISYCAVCDAFFYRGKDVAVLGGGEYAAHEAAELTASARSVIMLTNGAPAPGTLPDGVQVITTPITAIGGGDLLEHVTFNDGTRLDLSGVFVAIGVAGSAALARKIGADTDNNKIVVNADMATTIPGIFAAGDCTGGLLQISKAVYEGAKAGTEAVKFLRAL